ncbi:MAG: hypothetical protein SPK09_01685 [Porphyromonas sp.]|nr:hypothetical protein [Porphyromonas sp.]
MVQLYLQQAYEKATQAYEHGRHVCLEPQQEEAVSQLVNASENAKAVLAVVLTSLVYKLLHPEQDIRLHQAGLEGGYSGRSFDSRHITPFLKANKFPAMAESGWLTRSLEQKVPYTLDYPGAIRPASIKSAFLNLIDYIENGSTTKREELLQELLHRLIAQRESQQIPLAIPRNLNISQILSLLEQHWTSPYPVQGAARLPVLAVYATYHILLGEIKRFEGKELLALEKHTSADRRSGRMGDVDIAWSDGRPFEAVEVKHQIPLGIEHLETAYEKFMHTEISRYYILSTAEVRKEDEPLINTRIQAIKNTHGCQVIVNGIYTTLRYYLRLLEEPASFLEKYVQLLSQDETIKYEHKVQWNKLVSESFM